MKKYCFKFIYLLILSIIVLIAFTGIQRHLAYSAQKVYNRWMILTMILDKIERNYISEIDSDMLLKNAIHGMLAGLDEYSVYLTAEEYRDRESKYQGYIGLGIRFEFHKNQHIIIGISDNSPAYKAGLLVGDIILKINDRPTALLTEIQVQNLLAKSENELVKILIGRSGNETRLYTLNRAFINIKSIPCFFMINNTTGYINISHFVSTTPAELDNACSHLLARGMKQLLVDLRDNSGGSLLAGVQVADRFISQGKILVTTRGKTPQDNQKYISSDLPACLQIPLVVLVNAGTASVAEMFAATIQDWDRGLLFGEVTFGKACVQTEFLFPDGSALLLTTANYYTPLGRMIGRNVSGLTPAKPAESSAAARDNQQWREFKTPQGRIIYEGNGLRPDIITQVETAGITKMVRDLYTQNIFLNYAEKLVQNNPDLKTEIDSFFSEFSVTDKMLAEFYRMAKIGNNPALDSHLSQQIKQAIMQEIAYILWGLEGTIRAAVVHDPRIQESLACFSRAALLL